MISDFTCRIKNGQTSYLSKIHVKETFYYKEVLDILWRESFIRGYHVEDNNTLAIFLRYFKGKPSFNRLIIISKNSRKCFASWLDLLHYRKNFGVVVVSTPKGILTSDQAIKKRVGGEILAYFE